MQLAVARLAHRWQLDKATKSVFNSQKPKQSHICDVYLCLYISMLNLKLTEYLFSSIQSKFNCTDKQSFEAALQKINVSTI